jgi:hypothetical protein
MRVLDFVVSVIDEVHAREDLAALGIDTPSHETLQEAIAQSHDEWSCETCPDIALCGVLSLSILGYTPEQVEKLFDTDADDTFEGIGEPTAGMVL